MSSSSQRPPQEAPVPGLPAGSEGVALLDAVQAVVVLLDTQGCILHLNRYGARVLGYTAGEARGRKLEALGLPRAGQEEERAALARLVEGPYPARHESRWYTPDGQWRLIEWRSMPPTLGPDGKPASLVLTGMEVTERAQALQEQVYFFQTLIDSIPNPIFYKSLDGRYRGCNRAFTEMLGVTREQLLGRSVWDMSPPELAARYAAKDQELFDHPGVQQYESAVRFASGEVRDVIFYKATYTDTAGHLAGLVGVVLDITERKRAETALQQARDELEERVCQRTAELERLKDEAEAADHTKSEFLNLAAHELRTPLTALSLVLQQARRQLPPEASREEARLLSRMERYTGRLTRLAGDLLDASHLERGQLRLHPRPFELGDMVADVTEDFRHQHPRRRLEVVLPEGPTPVDADRERLEQVLANFLDNAVKYTPPEARLEVRLEALPGSFRVSVSDEGPGIPSEEHARLFERFHRLSSSVHQPGLGLGLYISRRIVEHHGGSIGLHCAPGDPGCTFFFEMPRRP